MPFSFFAGSKWTVVISMACYIFFLAAYFHATWEVFIPASVVLGFGAGPLWVGQSYYCNAVSSLTLNKCFKIVPSLSCRPTNNNLNQSYTTNMNILLYTEVV